MISLRISALALVLVYATTQSGFLNGDREQVAEVVRRAGVSDLSRMNEIIKVRQTI